MAFKDKQIQFKAAALGSVVVQKLAAFGVGWAVQKMTANPALAFAAGETAEQVTKDLSEAMASIAEGISLEDKSSRQMFLETLKKQLPQKLQSPDFVLPDSLRTVLESQVLDPEHLFELLAQPRPNWNDALKREILWAFAADPDATLVGVPLDEMADTILQECKSQLDADLELRCCVLQQAEYKKKIECPMYCANRLYADSFLEPLFLHKESPDGWRVTLRNLYVMPQYEEKYEIKNDLEKRLAAFITEDIPFLLVEGDAGTGKTTLSAWLNFHYVLGDKPYLFGGRLLVTVRLRDLDSETLKQEGFNKALLDYTQCSNLAAWPKNAILLLDGYDELCMIEQGGADPAGFLKNLETFTHKGFRVVVTSRHTYIPEKLPFQAARISLQHFDADKRRQWMKRYTAPDHCGQTLNDKVRKYIQEIDASKISCVCDTPMTLYMLAAGRENEKYLENDWALYRHIFMDALSETQYNEMLPNPTWDYQHHVAQLKEVLYRISEEIAFAMFKTGNAAFTLNDAALEEIVNRLKPDYPVLQGTYMEQVARHCYGLCCYWKTGGKKGAVEFLHNTIRDFFLAEYICRKLDAMVFTMQKTGENKLDQLTNLLARHLWYAPLEPNVLYFVYHRVRYNKQQGIPDYAKYEKQTHKIKDILDDFSDEGILRNAGRFFEEKKRKEEKGNLHWYTLYIVKNTMMLYRVAYEPYLEEGEYIRWCDRERENGDLVYNLFPEIFCNDPFCQCDLNHREKVGVLPFGLGGRGDFTRMDIWEMFQTLSDSDLRGMDLYGANLCGSNLHYVDLGQASLQGADLSDADLRNACLCNADLRAVDLRGANLINADLTEANLWGANLCGANLIGAKLPNGFKSYKQTEQILHLKKQKIVGLQLDAPGSTIVRQIQEKYDAAIRNISDDDNP